MLEALCQSCNASHPPSEDRQLWKCKNYDLISWRSSLCALTYWPHYVLSHIGWKLIPAERWNQYVSKLYRIPPTLRRSATLKIQELWSGGHCSDNVWKHKYWGNLIFKSHSLKPMIYMCNIQLAKWNCFPAKESKFEWENLLRLIEPTGIAGPRCE